MTSHYHKWNNRRELEVLKVRKEELVQQEQMRHHSYSEEETALNNVCVVHIHTCIHMYYLHMHIHTYTYMHICTYILLTCICEQAHTYIKKPTYTHAKHTQPTDITHNTYTHTNTYLYTHMHMWPKLIITFSMYVYACIVYVYGYMTHTLLHDRYKWS